MAYLVQNNDVLLIVLLLRATQVDEVVQETVEVTPTGEELQTPASPPLSWMKPKRQHAGAAPETPISLSVKVLLKGAQHNGGG